MVLQNAAYFVILLSVLIFVHELGHFLAAKALNVKVTRFSIGFGPRIVGWTRGETEYQLAWIPLGGYVKMAGEQGEDGPPEDEARGFLAQAPWKRAVIIGAGPTASLSFPILLYFIVALAFPQPSSRVMRVEPGMRAAQAGVRVGDLITAVDGKPVETFGQLRRTVEARSGKEITLSLDRRGQAIQLKLAPARSDEGALLGVAPVPQLPLVGVPAGSAAERAGLRTFDRIVSVDGQPVGDLVSLEQRLDAAKGPAVQVEALRRLPTELPGVEAFVPERIQAEVARQPGQGLAVLGAELPNLYLGRVVPGSAADAAGLVAGDRLLALDGQPLASFELLRGKLAALRDKPLRLTWVHQGVEHSAELQQTPVKQKDAYNRDVKALELGVVSAFDTLQGERPGFYAGERTVFDEVRLGPGAALSTAFRRVWETISAVAVSLALLLTGQVPFSNLGGPIMLYGIASQSAQAGLDQFLSIMALISINLGLLNLLPIPVLDGFGLLSAFWEWIRRRPIPMRAREIANMFGLAVLVLLMVAVFKNDITRLLN